ncbi:MAG: hypothetical protein WBA91_03295, partial [Paracoccaceae bacterium]
ARLFLISGLDMERFVLADASSIAEKVAKLPHMLRWIHTTSLVGGTPAFRLIFAAVSAGTILLGVVAALISSRRTHGDNKMVVAGRVLLGLATIIAILPVSFWMLYQSNFLPGRSLGFYGFALVAALLAFAQLLRPLTGRFGPAGIAALALVVLQVTAGSVASNRMAHVRGAASERDIALAASVAKAVSDLPGFEGRFVNMVGGMTYDDLLWGNYGVLSNFLVQNRADAALVPYLNLERWAANLPVGPKSCPALPEPGSAYVEGGVAYVCLQSIERGWTESHCGTVPEFDGRFCFGPGFAIAFVPRCEVALGGTGAIAFDFVDADGRSIEKSLAETGLWGLVPLGTGCAAFAEKAPDQFASVGLTGLSMKRETIWQVDLRTNQLVPW